MTQEVTRVQKNFNYCMDTLHAYCKLNIEYFYIAEKLQKIQNERLYEPQWSTFWEYCMEMRAMSLDTIKKLMAVHRKYVVEYKISPEKMDKIGWTVLGEALPLIKSKEQAMKLIESPETRQHIKKTIKEMKTGIKMDECKHEDSYLVRICRTCGDRWQEFHEHETAK